MAHMPWKHHVYGATDECAGDGAHEHAVEFWRSVGYELDARIERFVKTVTNAGQEI